MKDVLHLYFQRGSVDAGMTAEIGFVQKIPVDQKADRAGGVIHQPENADAAGSNRKSLQHLLRCGETEACTVQLTGKKFRFEGFFARHQQQIKIRHLAVREEEILADPAAEHLFYGKAGFNSVGMLMIHPVKGNLQIFQQIITALLHRNALLFRTGGIDYGINRHGDILTVFFPGSSRR